MGGGVNGDRNNYLLFRVDYEIAEATHTHASMAVVCADRIMSISNSHRVTFRVDASIIWCGPPEFRARIICDSSQSIIARVRRIYRARHQEMQGQLSVRRKMFVNQLAHEKKYSGSEAEREDWSYQIIRLGDSGFFQKIEDHKHGLEAQQQA